MSAWENRSSENGICVIIVENCLHHLSIPGVFEMHYEMRRTFNSVKQVGVVVLRFKIVRTLLKVQTNINPQPITNTLSIRW
jgi:hypothetical protein